MLAYSHRQPPVSNDDGCCDHDLPYPSSSSIHLFLLLLLLLMCTFSRC